MKLLQVCSHFNELCITHIAPKMYFVLPIDVHKCILSYLLVFTLLQFDE